MNDLEAAALNQFISAMLCLVIVMLVVVWGIPNGHCSETCQCRQPKNTRKEV